MAALSIIVMGVSGSGKSTVGAALARALNIKFIDGDDLHPRANIEKMARAEPLNDDDRAPWLQRINDAAFSFTHKNEGGVIVCSALKKAYRDAIRQDNSNLVFVFLEGDQAMITMRMMQRQGHFMKPGMLDSQFATLERPSEQEADVLTISAEPAVDEIVNSIQQALTTSGLLTK